MTGGYVRSDGNDGNDDRRWAQIFRRCTQKLRELQNDAGTDLELIELKVPDFTQTGAVILNENR